MTKIDEKDFHNDILKDLGVTPSEFDGVSTADLSAEENRLKVQIARLELEEKSEAQQKRKSKKATQKQIAEAQLEATRRQLAQMEARQRGCSHRKGGLGNSREGLPVEGGDADVYALLKHQLPNGDWLITCQRCCAEWRPADKFTGRPETIIAGFSWKDAFMARTDNSPSKSAVFRFEDHRTPDQVEAEAWRPPRNEKGEIIKDTLALPLSAEFSEPPTAVRRH
jgi:hypothetical protein